MISSLPPIMTPWPALPISRPPSPPATAPPIMAPMPRSWISKRARLVLGDASAQSRHVAAGDVARFVGEDADHLVRRIGLHERAGVHEDVAAVDDEGVEGIVVDDAHRDAAGAEPGSLEDLLRVVVEERLDFRIADERQALR